MIQAFHLNDWSNPSMQNIYDTVGTFKIKTKHPVLVQSDESSFTEITFLPHLLRVVSCFQTFNPFATNTFVQEKRNTYSPHQLYNKTTIDPSVIDHLLITILCIKFLFLDFSFPIGIIFFLPECRRWHVHFVGS